MLACVCLIVVCLAGCDQLFGLPHVDDIVTDAGGDAVTTDGALACPATYTLASRVSPSKYRYVLSNAPWTMAQETCAGEADGRAHLVVLTDDNERLDVLGLLADQGVTSSFWLGLSDRRTEGFFQWVTDEPVGTPPATTPPWGEFQPDDNGGTADCVRVQGSSDSQRGLFDDASCSDAYRYLCECDGIASEPANF